MSRPDRLVRACTLAALTLLAACGPGATATPKRTANFADLATLFADWRAFQRPARVNGAPDYSAAAMARQQQGLAAMRARLEAFDTTGWTVPQQVDWHVIRAEMNGLDFDHRVLRPWANNPAFYVTVFDEQSDQPAREGPYADGAVELWQQTFPLSAAAAAQVDSGLKRVPALLAQARTNLVGNGHDLWNMGAHSLRGQAKVLADLLPKVAGNAALEASVKAAQAATDSLATWVEAQVKTRTAPSGIGVANYTWYLQHVQLVPMTWEQEEALMQRELERSVSALALEEGRNAKLPAQAVVSSPAEFATRFGQGVTDYMSFLKAHDVMTVEPWMDGAMRARIGTFAPGHRHFFAEVDYRDPEVMRTHGYHWIDLGMMKEHPHADPIRRGPLLYNIFNTRTEGFATGWEEVMMHAGMFDAKPRSRELIWILLAERAARALGDLHMQANTQTLEQSAMEASSKTPRGWLSLDDGLVRGEQHIYLQQPGYGTSYVVGKTMLDALIAQRKAQLGDKYSFRELMDAVNRTGLVPASLVQWEITGVLNPETKKMLGAK
ncbi:MAG: DUF885 family protein [Gemmatimonadetes bacterium]|nr:DUF885 family protein [Gemmatimonadota bacterium]